MDVSGVSPSGLIILGLVYLLQNRGYGALWAVPLAGRRKAGWTLTCLFLEPTGFLQIMELYRLYLLSGRSKENTYMYFVFLLPLTYI